MENFVHTTKHFILAAFVITVVGCALAQNPVPTSETCTVEDYAIYSVVLQDSFGKQKISKLILIDETSIGFPPGMAAWTQSGTEARALLKDISKDIKGDFDVRNKTRVKIEAAKFKTSYDIVLLSEDTAEKLVNSAGGWQTFRDKYPKTQGLTLISRPGFNANHDQALLYIGSSCDTLCGTGKFIFLEKENGEWKVMNKATLWVS